MERTLPGLCPELDLEELGAAEIKTLGPFLVGTAAWKMLPRREYRSWREFKKAVEGKHGLSAEAMWVAFRGLHKERGESDEAFILRAEEQRRKHGEKRRICVHDFLPRTSREF